MARAIALGILLGGAVAAPALAADSVWTGAASDDWAEAGNWVVPPTSGSFVFIDSLAPNPARLETAADVGTLIVGDAADGALDIAGGGTLAVTGGDDTYSVGMIVGNQEGASGTVTVSGAGSMLSTDQSVQIGNEGDGTLKIVDGATAELAMHGPFTEVGIGAGYFYGALGAGAGHVLVDGAGSTLTHAGGINLVKGTLDISNGGQIVSVPRAEDSEWAPAWIDGVGADVGDGSNDSVATVTGAGSAWNSRNALQIAYGGTGTLNVLDGAAANFAGFAIVGNRSTLYDAEHHPTGEYVYGNGTLLVSGEDSSFALAASEIGSGDFTVGLYGTGDATIAEGAGATIAGAAIVGGTADAEGSLNIVSGGTMTVAGTDGYGTGLIVGNVAGSEGEVTVSGAGSLLTVNGGTQIGNSGTGSLSVLDGGRAELGLEYMYVETVMGLSYYGWGADAAKGRGTLLVDGAGSTLAYAGGLNVLAGDVTVRNGGQLESIHRDVDGETTWIDLIGWGVPADPDPSHGFSGLRGVSSVTVTGAGSAWNSVNGVDLGDGGDGKLSVLDGGSASFGDTIRAGGESYLYDSLGGSRVPNLAPRVGTGTIVVSGAGSSLVGESRAVIGDRKNSTGSLAVAAGGVATVHGADANLIGLTVGNLAGSKGAVTVDGKGSSLVVDAGMQIGNAGSGSVSVTGGGTINASLATPYAETVMGFTYYGWGADAAKGAGKLVVDGAGSTFNYAGGLNLLNGTVSITDGGQLVSHAREGETAGTTWIDLIGWGVPASPDPENGFAGLKGMGSVTVSGAGSAWTGVNHLHVGDGGDGMLSVLDGGKAMFGGFAVLGGYSYLYESNGGPRVPDLAPQLGAGSLLVSGAGSAFTVTATDAYAGYINVGYSGAGSLQVAEGGSVTAPGGIWVGPKGSLTIGGLDAATGLTQAPGTVAAPTITLQDAAARLVFNHTATAHDDTAYAFAPVISGNGQVDVAAGFTRLTGDSSAFAGQTTVDGGATLSVNGSLGGDLLVAGRLQGTGTIGDTTIQSGGTLAPGNSPGTLHVDGDLVMESGSLYDAEIDGDTGLSDSVQVAGNVVISSGTTLSVTNIGNTPLTPGVNLQLIQTTGDDSEIQGQFDSVTGSSDFLDLGLSYEGGKIVVEVERSEAVTFASAADPAFKGVGAALDGLSDESALTALLFTQVTSVDQAKATIPGMAGTMHADLRRAMVEDSRYSREAVGDRLRDDDASGGVAWARAMGGSGSADGAGVLPGASVDHAGVMVGYDTAVGDTRLGVAIGTDKGEYSTDGNASSANIYSRHVALYGRSLVGGLRVGYGLAFGASDAKGERNFAIGNAAQHAYSKHEASTTQGFVDLGYRLDGGKSFRYLEPFLNIARVQVKDDAAVETGSIAALEIASGDASATFGTVGLRWSADMGAADFTGSIGWRHAFGFDGATSTQSFVAGGPSFTVGSLPVDNAVMLDLGAKFRMSQHVRAWLGYTGMFSGSAHDNGVKFQVGFDL